MNESTEFTPWLADEENISLLGAAIGIDGLELESTEQRVGSFSADILCKDSFGRWILIENQLDKTDHSHLGQLLTYAAGLKAVAIVWIAREFREEHRSALDWLNTITREDIGFFGVEVELWRIGQSEVAPKFNLVSKPNDWEKRVADTAQRMSNETLTVAKQLQLEYWTDFAAFVTAQSKMLKSTKPSPQNWMSFAIGTSGAYLNAIVNTRDRRISVQLLLNKFAKENFSQLYVEKAAIEQEIGCSLIWRELPEGKQSYVDLTHDFDPNDKSDWQNQHQWLCQKLESFRIAFSHRLKLLRNFPRDRASENVETIKRE